MTKTIPVTTDPSDRDRSVPVVTVQPLQAVQEQDPNQAGTRDILVFRGAEYWPTPEDVIREVHRQGLSVRIPRNNIPEGMIRGLSRIALAHIKAVMVIEKGTPEELRAAFEGLHDEAVDAVLALKYEHAPSQWLEMPESEAKLEILSRLGVSFQPGIFAYCYWTSTAYYLKPDEGQAPEDLARKGVKPIRGIISATGEMLTSETPDTEGEEE